MKFKRTILLSIILIFNLITSIPTYTMDQQNRFGQNIQINRQNNISFFLAIAMIIAFSRDRNYENADQISCFIVMCGLLAYTYIRREL